MKKYFSEVFLASDRSSDDFRNYLRLFAEHRPTQQRQ